MKYEIKPRCLVLTVDKTEQAAIAALKDEDGFDSDNFTYEMLENLFTNDSFSWIDARYTGDLTDAPMLAILGDQEARDDVSPQGGDGYFPCGRDGEKLYFQPVLYRWAHMDYQTTSVQRQLAETGRAVLPGGRMIRRKHGDVAYQTRELSLKTPWGFAN